MSIFNEQVTPDYYVDHMRETLSWIKQKIYDTRRYEAEEEHKHPGYRSRTVPGYITQITVEATWLEQLIAELIGKHQVIMAYQRQCAQIMDMHHMHELTRPIVFSNPNPPDQKGTNEIPKPTP